jgi:hypothetical protein
MSCSSDLKFFPLFLSLKYSCTSLSHVTVSAKVVELTKFKLTARHKLTIKIVLHKKGLDGGP